MLISGLRDKHLVDRLVVRNSQSHYPRFLDPAKRLLALNTNVVPDDSATLSAIGLQKSVNQKNEIEESKGLITDLQKELQDIRNMCIKQRSTHVITCYFCGKSGHLQKNYPGAMLFHRVQLNNHSAAKHLDNNVGVSTYFWAVNLVYYY